MIERILSLLSPRPWRWATIQLMGKVTMRGQVQEFNAGIRTRTFNDNGTGQIIEGVSGWASVYHVEYMSEGRVRESFVRRHRYVYGLCDTWDPSAVEPTSCRRCGGAKAMHHAPDVPSDESDPAETGPYEGGSDDDIPF